MAPTPLTPPPDAVVFDFDGVVIDSRPPVRAAIREALAAHGFPDRKDAELDRAIGPPTAVAFATLTGEPEGSPEVAACIESYRQAYARVYLNGTALVDGIDAVLDALAPPLALATSKESEFVEPLLHHLGIAHNFTYIAAATGDEHKPAIVRRALDALGARAAAIVGDRSFDVDAARATDIRAVGVTWGIGTAEELAGADVIVNEPRELLEVLPCR